VSPAGARTMPMQHRSDAGRPDATGPDPNRIDHTTAAAAPDERDAAPMRRALELAERGRPTTSPNPLVGCVLVRGEGVVGEGWHERPGGPHAEIVALAAAGERARGATAYVTLEPCDHHGRTPPCSDALLAAGVVRIVIATLDPNPLVDGRGAARLRDAGVEVRVGVLAAEAEAQNVAYRTAQRLGRPWVRYKTAMTLDGKIATRTGQSRWITGEASRALVQRWRHESDAVAVGVSTVLLDDPRLTARVPLGRSPRKVVFDSVARTPPQAALFEPDEAGETARVTLLVGPAAPATRLDALRQRGADVVVSDDGRGRPDVTTALRHLLTRQGVTSLLLEGGGTLAWSFVEARAIDRVAWFVGPMLLGGKGASPLGGLGVATIGDAIGLDAVAVRHLGPDLLVEGDVRYAARPGPDGAAGASHADGVGDDSDDRAGAGDHGDHRAGVGDHGDDRAGVGAADPSEGRA
jgi:diaminohydroxyphosphoribosylaminopyrimidine deaminase / 5-amino-6-(5-phosphoribosylamino)uracil reductase